MEKGREQGVVQRKGDSSSSIFKKGKRKGIHGKKSSILKTRRWQEALREAGEVLPPLDFRWPERGGRLIATGRGVMPRKGKGSSAMGKEVTTPRLKRRGALRTFDTGGDPLPRGRNVLRGEGEKKVTFTWKGKGQGEGKGGGQMGKIGLSSRVDEKSAFFRARTGDFYKRNEGD